MKNQSLIILAILIAVSIVYACKWLFHRNRLFAKEKEDRDLAQQKFRESQERKAWVMGFPIMRLTRTQFEKLPKASEIDYRTCSIGTIFIIGQIKELPDVHIVGHVVASEDLFDSQWGGAALSLPKQAPNRYRLEIIG